MRTLDRISIKRDPRARLTSKEISRARWAGVGGGFCPIG